MYNVQSESFQTAQKMKVWQIAHNSSARLRYSRIRGVISCWLQLSSMCHCKIMTRGVWLCVVPSVICAPSANGTLYGKNICIKFCFKLHNTVNETFHVSKKQSISLSVHQSIISMLRESMTNTLQCDMHVDCFLWHSRNCAPQTHSTDTNICVDFYNKMCGKNNLGSGIMETGSTINTPFQHTLFLCRNFWTIMARLLTCTLWTLWRWHPSEFFLFPKLNWCWGTEISLYQHVSRTAGYICRVLNTECSKII